MFDMNKLGDLAGMAKQAKSLQANQDRFQKEQMDSLKKISSQLDRVIDLLEKRQR